MKMNTEIILGPPGTGKTTRLMDILESELKQVSPHKIAFVSFTKKAVDEAIDRAVERFRFSRTDMVYFKTIHAMSFASAGLKMNDVMKISDYKKIGSHLGITFSNNEMQNDPMLRSKYAGDKYNFIDGFSKARNMSAKTVWDMVNHDDMNWFEFKRYRDTLVEYKRKYNKLDFADMLLYEPAPLEIDVVIIDEAQDLSTAQWQFINKVFVNAKRMYIGGDDDQAIFEWSGADVAKFIKLEGNRTILSDSYRIPRSVHGVASEISSKIKLRADKPYTSRKQEGSVDYWGNVDDVDMSNGSWLLLARNAYLMGELGASCYNRGYAYTIRSKSSVNGAHVEAIQLWEKYRNGLHLSPRDREGLKEYTSNTYGKDIWHVAFDKMEVEVREYYVSLLRRGESLTKEPRIKVSTIHGSKGGEADNVVLLTDMAYSTWDATNLNMDSEHRVWYVGATRCKEALHIIRPRGRYYYDV